MKEIDVVVEHPKFGIGEIKEINFNPNPIISVLWRNGKRSLHPAEELEFLRVNNE